ncbi:hypothetical protein LPB86_20490 [Pedobacter sp. MC2016-14]|uniref:hypothetical protein n=1 Tax=Pedobacter sp. MC2016-14 TaxID=2897327 RepID=UPI001E2B11D0|nr:hypothetical protein [Pedobacter sp. MC2016-14]MCD0490628.1 hypothetical protein [Pedobacter sp. MC2016-14]
MKTKLTKLGATLLCVFALQMSAFAVSYPLYLCGGATAALRPDATVTAALLPGDRIMWQEFQADGTTPIGTVTEIAVTTAATAPAYTTASGLATGAHVYKVFVISAAPNTCSGDVSDPFSLYVLPTSSVTLGAPTVANYCEAGGSATSSVVTATPSTFDSSLTDVSFAFTWTATKDGAAVSDVTTVGTAASNVFTINTTAVGEYTVKTSIAYTVSSGVLKSGDSAGCVQSSGSSTAVKVTAKPGKPVISFT